MNKNNRTYYLLILTIGVLIFLNVKQCSEKKSINNQRDNSSSFLNDTVETYINKLNQQIAEKKTLAGDNKQLKILLSKQIDSTQELAELVKKYKSISGAGIVNTITKIDTVYVPFNQPVGLYFERNINIKDDHYRLNAIVNQDGFTLNNLEIPNKLSFVIGQKKNGWFRSTTYNIDVKNSNPYIKTIGVDAYQFTPDIKRWSFGPYVGFDLFQQNVSAGVSLQYGIIRF